VSAARHGNLLDRLGLLARLVCALAPLLLVALAALLLPKLWLGAGGPYGEQAALAPFHLLTINAVLKVLALAAASALAWASAAGFGTGNPAATGWRLIALGFAAFTGGQLVLSWYQLVARTESPYPSIADPLFVAGMLLLVAALVRFLLVYTGDAMPLGSRSDALRLSLLAVVPLALLGGWLLRPVLAHPAAAAEQALNVTYPLLDCLLLVPTFALARLTSRLRGGRLHLVWTALLAGFLATAAGDVMFAYFTTLGVARLDPLVDLMYGTSYVLWAWGGALQLRLVAGEEPLPLRAAVTTA
jgi:hypothetical protein